MKIDFTNHELLELCLKQHQEHLDNKIFQGVKESCSCFGYHKEFSLSLNFGRQFGYTSFIKKLLEQDDDYILLFNRGTSYIRDTFGRVNVDDVFSVNHIRGRNLTQKNILIDRSMFNDSNYKIIETIFNENVNLMQNANRVIILG